MINKEDVKYLAELSKISKKELYDLFPELSRLPKGLIKKVIVTIMEFGIIYLLIQNATYNPIIFVIALFITLIIIRKKGM